MEQTLQSQYNLIKEGKGNKAVFLKSAYRLFPDMLSPVNTFEDTVKILKNRSIISEGIGGLVTSGKKQDWHAIFNENMDKLKDEEDGEYDEMIKRHEEEEDAKHTLPNYRNLKEDDAAVNKENIKKAVEHYNQNAGRISIKDAAAKFNVAELDVMSALQQGATNPLFESKEKEPPKEVTDMATSGYDYKDEKNYDNVFGQEFLKGYYTELKDPKNADKHVEELREIVAKNLAKDINYYVKDGQFGIKGVGYQTEAPGLGTPKEPTGKFKSSGYGDIPKSKDLKESVLRSQIQFLIKEVLNEVSKGEAIEAAEGDKIVYKNSKGKEVEDVIVNLSLGGGDPLPTAKLKNGDTVNLGDAIKLIKKALNEDKKPSKAALTAAEELYDELGSVKKAIDALPEKYKEYKKTLEAHLNFKFRD
jgi:hypothetical protein